MGELRSDVDRRGPPVRLVQFIARLYVNELSEDVPDLDPIIDT